MVKHVYFNGGSLRSSRDIFSDALDIADQQQRQAFLDGACAGDAQRRAAIERLLSAHYKGGGNLIDEAVAQLGPAETVGSAMAASPESDIAGRPLIGNYQLLEQIGEGGMGTVFRAQQTQPIRRQVALKVIKTGMDSREVIARFQAERQALAMMDHPNIARVLDAGTTTQGQPYFVMELVPGMPITDYCDHENFSLNQRLRLLIDVCGAVQHAHQKGIIHRDLKPSNVMVALHEGGPVVKVIDFGVSKALNRELSEQTLLTHFSQMIGTPLYMSPEQAEMSNQDIDTRSDVYSLGVLLYELLTGTTPFDKQLLSKAGLDDVRQIIREQDPLRPSHKISTLDAQVVATVSNCRKSDTRRLALSMRRELDWIAMKALEKDRNRRYESAGAMAADIQRYLADEPVQACPPSTAYRLKKLATRYRGILVAAAVIVLALLGGLAGTTWQAVRATQAERAVRDESRRARANEVQAVNNEKDALKNEKEAISQRNAALVNLYKAEMNSGQADAERGYMQRLNDKLLGHLPLAGQLDRRGWEWYYLFSLCHQESRTLRSSAPSAHWSPDGEYIAAAGSIWEATSGRLVRRLQVSYIRRYHGRWSPDSQMFAWGMAADDCGVYVWDRRTDELKELRGHSSSVWCVDWSPDGKRLASGGIDGTIRIWDVAKQTTTKILPAGKTSDGMGVSFITDLGWSPNGSFLIAASKWHLLNVWNLEAEEPHVQKLELLTENGTGYGTDVTWHPDGRLLAASTPNAWFLIDPQDWSIAWEQAFDHGRGKDISWSPDGRRIALAEGETILIWDSATERMERTVQGHLLPIESVAWSPDGRQIISADGQEIKIWEMPARDLPPEVIATGAPMQSLEWLPDGQTLVTLDMAEATPSFWDARTRKHLRTEAPMGSGQPVWSPNRRLVTVHSGEVGGDVSVLDAADGSVHSIYHPDSSDAVKCVAWSPDSRLLAILVSQDAHTKVSFWDVDRETLVSTWSHLGPEGPGPSRMLAWSPTGNRVAVTALGELGDNGSTSRHGHIYVVDTKSGVTILKHNLGGPVHSDNVASLAWKPDGETVLAGSRSGLMDAVEVATGRVSFSTRLYSSGVNALAWSPDGRRIVSAAADGSVKIVSTYGGNDLLAFDLGEAATHVAWSPDGKRLAAATQQGGIHVWDASPAYDFSPAGSRRAELAWAYHYSYYSRRQSTSGSDQVHLRDMLRLAPDTLEFWEMRGHTHATLGEFDRAIEEFTKAIGPGLGRSFSAARSYGYALLGAGNTQAFHRHIAAMLEEFVDTKVPSNGRLVAWLAALTSHEAIDRKTMVRLAQSDAGGDADSNHSMLVLAAARYRDDQYQQAADELSELAANFERSPDLATRSDQAYALYFLAMARHQLGHPFQARRYLSQATKLAEDLATDSTWTIRVQLEVLDQEVRALIGD